MNLDNDRRLKYRDMLDMPHHTSVKHLPMSRYHRAAQFAPFAALTGYEEELEKVEEKKDK